MGTISAGQAGQDHGSAGTNNLILDTSRGGNEGRLHFLMARCHVCFFLVAAVACVPTCAVSWPGHCLRRHRWFTMAIMSLDLDKWTRGQMTDISLSIQIQMFWLLLYTRGYKHKIFIVVSHNLNLV